MAVGYKVVVISEVYTLNFVDHTLSPRSMVVVCCLSELLTKSDLSIRED